MPKWNVTFGETNAFLGPRSFVHWEDGFTYHEKREGYTVLAEDERGHVYLHDHHFDTFESCERFVRRVWAHLDLGGDLDLEHWHYWRTVYGSPAYLDEEPFLVAREKADALGGLDYA